MVSYGTNFWILDDGTTGRPLGGAGPNVKHFPDRDTAQTEIDRFKSCVHDSDFAIVSTRE